MKTICEGCNGTGTCNGLSGIYSCDSCCGRGYFGEDDAVIAAEKARVRKEKQEVNIAAREIAMNFAEDIAAKKIVASLRRKKLLVNCL